MGKRHRETQKLTSLPAQNIGASSSSDWFTASIAAVYSPENSPYRLYYAQPDNGEILAYFISDSTTDDWDFNNGEDSQWGKVQGGFTAASWEDQVRIYYFSDGKLVMSAQDGTEWASPSSL